MEDDVGVRKLLELIFVKKFIITAEMTATDSSFPDCLLTNDFSEKLFHIFLARHMIIKQLWKKKFEFYTIDTDTVSNPENYLFSIIAVCYYEYHCQLKIFDSFISVCSIVKYFSEEVFRKKMLNFCELNFDIVMEFYESVLKKSFLKCGGFKRLVEYIHRHKYLAWKWDKNHLSFFDDSSTPPNVDIAKKIDKELFRERNVVNSYIKDLSVMNTSAEAMVRRILSTTSADISTIPRDHDSNLTEGASGLSDQAKTAGGNRRIEADLNLEPLDKVFQGCSNSDAKTNYLEKQKEDITRFESIVQIAMRYNRSKTSGLGTSDDRLEKVEGIVKHFKETIESLIDVLDEYEKE